MQQNPRFPVWDIPTRLFHWLLAIGFFSAWITYKANYMVLHSWIGYGMLTLLLFRVIWGAVGSPHSRFRDFVRGPGSVYKYLKGQSHHTPGHNPLGGWSVVSLLLLLIAQAVTGLFNGDDILFSGPLRAAVSSDVANALGSIHETLYFVILGLVGLHIAAVCWYHWVKKEPLVHAMIHGHKRNRNGAGKPASLWLAGAVLLACAGMIWFLLSLAPEPEFFY